MTIGRRHGLSAVRVPAEPYEALRRSGATARSLLARIGGAFLDLWVGLLRRRLRSAGFAVNDYLFGLAWTGAMTETRVLSLLPHIPEGISEIYFHPATSRTSALVRTMPEYRHAEEYAGLLSAAVRRGVAASSISLIAYRDLSTAGPCSASP